MSNLKQRIQDEMTTDYKDALDKHFEEAKTHISISESGAVDVKNQESLNNEDKLAAYLLGKLYAYEGELSDQPTATYEELCTELSMPEGSARPKMNDLVEGNIVQRVSSNGGTEFELRRNRIESVLKRLSND